MYTLEITGSDGRLVARVSTPEQAHALTPEGGYSTRLPPDGLQRLEQPVQLAGAFLRELLVRAAREVKEVEPTCTVCKGSRVFDADLCTGCGGEGSGEAERLVLREHLFASQANNEKLGGKLESQGATLTALRRVLECDVGAEVETVRELRESRDAQWLELEQAQAKRDAATTAAENARREAENVELERDGAQEELRELEKRHASVCACLRDANASLVALGGTPILRRNVVRGNLDVVETASATARIDADTEHPALFPTGPAAASLFQAEAERLTAALDAKRKELAEVNAELEAGREALAALKRAAKRTPRKSKALPAAERDEAAQ